MPKNHLKTLNAPKTWAIKRKKNVFITRPKPGAHSFKEGMPLNVLIRDILEYTDTKKEVKHILMNKDILVDGKPRKDHRILVGLMDVVSFPKKKEHLRLLFNKKGKIDVVKIKENESNIKICKIKGKTIVKKGKIQLNLHDGKNILINKNDYKVGDSLVLELPALKIKEHLKLESKSTIYLTGGRHIAETGVIEDIKGENIVYKSESGEVYKTLKDYAFVVGKTKSLIELENKNE
ncbi:30S ribosomal protein S4e [Candidatus Woesearchaeota archaeon]|nr:30S ribosomal protein S4e [Candidatus Woesearchaeota archaeon]